MEDKFTPGPWNIRETPDGLFVDAHPKSWIAEFPSAHVPGVGLIYTDQSLANARLIAAAPNLYESLCTLIQMVEDDYGPDAKEIRAEAFEALNMVRRGSGTGSGT